MHPGFESYDYPDPVTIPAADTAPGPGSKSKPMVKRFCARFPLMCIINL
ncbi:MAG: hypothetical protein QGH40_02435 [bacterium]|nr:hypothetical protein [bacterium]